MSPELRERASGCLLGLAIGDALGMPTQSLPRQLITARYGLLVGYLSDAPADSPVAAGLPAGHVTDDTEQAVLLAQLLIENGGKVDVLEWADRLIGWEQGMRARGSFDLLGPSTRRALAELAAGGDPTTTGRFGDTNGAAMRVAPLGIAVPSNALDVLLAKVIALSRPTHGTGLALAGAAAVATFVSAALDGAGLADATREAVSAARRTDARGYWVAGARVAERIEHALIETATLSLEDVLIFIDTVVGTSVRANESVPAAFAAVHAADGDPWLAVRIGASVGGDCDTIAAIAGAMAGALAGGARFPDAAVERVRAVNDLRIDALVDGLLRLRTS